MIIIISNLNTARWETGEKLGDWSKKLGREGVGLLGADRGYP